MKKFLSGLLLIMLMSVLTGIVSADDLYTFTLADGVTILEDAGSWYIDVKTPHISGMADEDVETELNGYFEGLANSIWAEYNDEVAYAAENWELEDMPHFGYEYSWNIVYENDDYLVFKTLIFVAAGSSSSFNEYWTLDKHSGLPVALRDVADGERMEEIHDMIQAAMEKRNESGKIYWLEDNIYDAAFSFVEANHHWYINEGGNLVIVFDKYEVAPGAYGASEFEITDNKAVLIEEEKNVFDLYVRDRFDEETENWSIHLVTPALYGLDNEDEAETLNEHFIEYSESLKRDYEALKESAEESLMLGNQPRFSYAYFYKIISDNDNYFVFKTEYDFIAASFSNQTEYWNLDKNTRRLLSIADVIPENGMQMIYDQIYAEMKAANKSGQGHYYIDDDAETLDFMLSVLDETHNWYLNSDGELVIAFDKYDIAPGVMGSPEFVIDFEKEIPEQQEEPQEVQQGEQI